jgi:hypothetical protein
VLSSEQGCKPPSNISPAHTTKRPY